MVLLYVYFPYVLTAGHSATKKIHDDRRYHFGLLRGCSRGQSIHRGHSLPSLGGFRTIYSLNKQTTLFKSRHSPCTPISTPCRLDMVTINPSGDDTTGWAITSTISQSRLVVISWNRSHWTFKYPR
ncbi:hypothetical protein H2248_008456 [Termitomyces sp. 'cryptogamus']|nr:hypothetical protein H2248_008456 [Termitomyces sp. 'cryptogamus']